MLVLTGRDGSTIRVTNKQTNKIVHIFTVNKHDHAVLYCTDKNFCTTCRLKIQLEMTRTISIDGQRLQIKLIELSKNNHRLGFVASRKLNIVRATVLSRSTSNNFDTICHASKVLMRHNSQMTHQPRTRVDAQLTH